MAVWVRCTDCGTEHPSRFRARSRETFGWLEPFVGPIVEPCGHCGARPLVGAPHRAWRDAPRAAEAPPG